MPHSPTARLRARLSCLSQHGCARGCTPDALTPTMSIFLPSLRHDQGRLIFRTGLCCVGVRHPLNHFPFPLILMVQVMQSTDDERP